MALACRTALPTTRAIPELDALCFDYAAMAGGNTTFWVEDLNGVVVAESGGRRHGRTARSAVMNSQQVRYAACALGPAANAMVPYFARACQREVDHAQLRRAAQSRRTHGSSEVTGLSHDLNNLLGTIAGNVELLEPVVEHAARAKEQLARIARACRLASLFVSRLGNAGGAAERTSVDLAEVADEIVELVAERAGAGVQILCKHELGAARVEADPVAMEQLILNLVLNALAAVGEEGRLEIMLSAEPQAGGSASDVVLRVVDDGCGMDEVTLAYARRADATPQQGAGVGLGLIARIVAEHGGRIDIASSIGRGTEVEIVFPSGLGADYRQAANVSAERVHG